MSQADKKQRAAEAALDYIPFGAIVGVGSGSNRRGAQFCDKSLLV